MKNRTANDGRWHQEGREGREKGKQWEQVGHIGVRRRWLVGFQGRTLVTLALQR